MNIKKLVIVNIILFICSILFYCYNMKINSPKAEVNVVQNNIPVEEKKKDEYSFYDISLSRSQQIFIQEELKKYSGISYELVLSIISVESNFNINAISKTNDYGLMQLNSFTFQWVAKQFKIENPNPLDFETNIKCGIWYLNHIKNYWINYGTPEEYLSIHTIHAYHMGIQGTIDAIENNVYNNKYVSKVLSVSLCGVV